MKLTHKDLLSGVFDDVSTHPENNEDPLVGLLGAR